MIIYIEATLNIKHRIGENNLGTCEIYVRPPLMTLECSLNGLDKGKLKFI